jgi:hypothetical protein
LKNPVKFHYTALPGIPSSSVSIPQNTNIASMKDALITCILKKSRQNWTFPSKVIEFLQEKAKISRGVSRTFLKKKCTLFYQFPPP